jgi:hypothetical protein
MTGPALAVLTGRVTIVRRPYSGGVVVDLGAVDLGAVPWWAPVASALVGFLFGQANFWITTRVARRQRNEDRRRDFQRATLIELQEIMFEIQREASAIPQFHETAWRTNGHVWMKGVVPAEQDEKWREGRARATVLVARLTDAELKADVEDVRLKSGSAVTTPERDKAYEFQKETKVAFEKLNKRIGHLLAEVD